MLSKDGAQCKPSKVKTKEEIPMQKITRISGGGIVMSVVLPTGLSQDAGHRFGGHPKRLRDI
jgi:hypothetical protein